MADILVVEDDRAIARGLQTNLEFERHRVRHLLQGDQVAEVVRDHAPDLLILDVMLPGLNGFEVCRRIRQFNTHLPILMLTARADDMDKAMGLDLGADDYVTKPFSLTELLARVRALLRRAGKRGVVDLPDSLTFGGNAVDFGRFQATRDNAFIHLTSKEFMVLQHLAAESGAAVRRDVLIDRVWGEDVNVTTRTVDTHILSLRQKLEPDPSAPKYLLTVHGIGYRFVGDLTNS